MERVSLLEILIWVHYKGMWIKNLLYMCPIRIEIIYGRGNFVVDFNMDNIIWTNFMQIMLPILKSPTNLPLQ